MINWIAPPFSHGVAIGIILGFVNWLSAGYTVAREQRSYSGMKIFLPIIPLFYWINELLARDKNINTSKKLDRYNQWIQNSITSAKYGISLTCLGGIFLYIFSTFTTPGEPITILQLLADDTQWITTVTALPVFYFFIYLHIGHYIGLGIAAIILSVFGSMIIPVVRKTVYYVVLVPYKSTRVLLLSAYTGLKTKYNSSKSIILSLSNRITKLSFSSSTSKAGRNTTVPNKNNNQLNINGCVPDTISQPSAVSVDYDAIDRRGVIGRGGNAEVTRAIVQNGNTEIELAIKQPHFSETLNTDSAERIFQEARKWERIGNHDHILTVVDYGGQPVPWIAMEYMDGGHLGERSGVLDISQSLWTALAVTEAVGYAHRQNIVHLDLKPQNILFQHMSDAWDVPKVADWELSKNIIDKSTRVDGISINYAAPEQINDEYGELNEKTDIYQLGAVFYELVTGQPPFESSQSGTVEAIQSEQPEPPSNIVAGAAPVDDILLRALAKEKTARYANIESLRDDLEEVFNDYTTDP